MTETTPLRIGYVPEHFSTPLYFAQKHFALSATLIPFPSGTGHMITSLRAGEIDVGIGLTEGWVAGLGTATGSAAENEGGYKIVGTYVETPLSYMLPNPPGWAISTGSSRSDITSIADLKAHNKIGVSRIGSGSYVMGFVLADSQGWLDTDTSSTSPFEVKPLQTFEKLRGAVNDGTADFFMWEHFTSKRYYDNGEIKRVGEIYTPWPSWEIVASTTTTSPSTDPRLAALFQKLDLGIAYFETHLEEAVQYISGSLDYSVGDAKEWLQTVRFARGTRGVEKGVVEGAVGVLRKAGVLKEGEGVIGAGRWL
ncbi:hypothetical protein LCER1_G007229, partial [Lachnellula cervina]